MTDRVSLVGSGQTGLGLTHPLDCNVYLLEGGAEAALVDAGCGIEPERILARVKGLGVGPDDIGYVLLTHCHADHSGGARSLAETLNADVVAPARSASALRTADEDATSLARARSAGGYPADYMLAPVPVALEVGEGDKVQVGDLRLEVLETPGHSADHVSYLLREDTEVTLFGGDTVLADGRVMLLPTPDCDIFAYSRTLRRLADARVDSLMPGHGAFLFGAAEMIATCASYFERLKIPPLWP